MGDGLLFIVLEVQTAEQAEHKLFQEVHISLCAGKYVVFSNAVHAAGNEINNKYAVFIGNIADEILAVHERAVLYIVKEMYHIVPYQQGNDMLFVDYIAAVLLAESAEYCRMAGSGAFLRHKAAVMAEFVKYHIFLCTEE